MGFINVKFDLDDFKNEDFEAGWNMCKKDMIKLIKEIEGYTYCSVKNSDKIIFKKSKDAPFIKKEEIIKRIEG